MSMAYVKKPPNSAVTIGAIVMLVTLAGILLVKYTYEGPGIGDTWPALFIGAGLCCVLGGMLELGIGVMAGFGLWLAANLNWVSGTKLWPFLVLVVALLVAVGYMRARHSHDQEKKG
jgi:hypothetical protein